MRTLHLLLITLLLVPVLSARKYDKAGRWQVAFTPQYIASKSLSYGDKGDVEFNDRSGWGFGIGYFVSSQISLDMNFLSTTGGFKGTVNESNGTQTKYKGNMYSSSFDMSMTYNILKDNFTPFVSINVGSSFIDSGIATGNYYTGTCYDPWYGYYYTCYDVETKTSFKFHYGATLGLRYDLKNRLFFKGGVNANVLDFNSEEFPYFISYQLSVGSTF